MSNGLDGVVAAETVLSHTDRRDGMVWVRGHDLPDLVAHHGFEGMVALLWRGFAGDDLTRASVTASLGQARVAAFTEMAGWMPLAKSRPIQESLRIALAAQPDDASPSTLLATLAVAVPALLRAEQGLGAVAPEPSVSTAEDLLRMLHGRAASAEMVAALDVYFTVMGESGLSASAFTGRCVASTHASLTSAVIAAWSAFTGALHGGAPGPTLDLIDAAQRQDDLVGWLEARLRAGERLMGFGHRVFSGNDPRAEQMRIALDRMGPMAGRLAFAQTLEAAVAEAIERVKPGRKLPPNVEIMAALLLDAAGIPRQGFTPVFAVGRCAGWIAHALEQRKTGRMIRPISAYVGPPIG